MIELEAALGLAEDVNVNYARAKEFNHSVLPGLIVLVLNGRSGSLREATLLHRQWNTTPPPRLTEQVQTPL
jgi:hypothetical protein